MRTRSTPRDSILCAIHLCIIMLSLGIMTRVLALALLLGLPVLAVAEVDKPNIVLIFADDLGYGDLAVYGHPTSTSPNLDKMAAEGLLFTSFYSSSPVCSPSRASILTGRYQTRNGVYPGVFDPANIGGLPLEETTIAEVLKPAGYKSAIIGKWHLGVGENNTYLPTNQGFDYYMGIPYSHDFCPCFMCFYPSTPCFDTCRQDDTPCPVFENTKIVQQPADLLHLTDTYITAATSFIKSKAAQKQPFFLYMAFQHTHHPQFAGPKFTNSSVRLKFGDALNEMDWGVGEIFSAMKEAGVSNNTFVFFTADNGPSLVREIRGGNAGPLRCGKGTTWEGGMREPAIAWWPGKITPGRTQQLAATVDLLPTFAAVAGTDPPVGVILDGLDMSPILFQNQPSNRDWYIYFSSGVTKELGVSAVRWHQYKAHYNSHGGLCPDTYPDVVCRSNFSLHHYDPPLLYDLNSDPGELYVLNPTQYSTVLAQIDKVKVEFESTLVWGLSQMERGQNSLLEPCANQTCIPSDPAWPGCCRTNTLRLDVSRAIP